MPGSDTSFSRRPQPDHTAAQKQAGSILKALSAKGRSHDHHHADLPGTVLHSFLLAFRSSFCESSRRSKLTLSRTKLMSERQHFRLSSFCNGVSDRLAFLLRAIRDKVSVPFSYISYGTYFLAYSTYTFHEKPRQRRRQSPPVQEALESPRPPRRSYTQMAYDRTSED